MNYNQAEHYWTTRSNDLPDELRQIAAAQESRIRIQHLRFERDRLTARYKQSIKEIDEHIEACAKSLVERTENILVSPIDLMAEVTRAICATTSRNLSLECVQQHAQPCPCAWCRVESDQPEVSDV
jgi:hypothetical protein